MSIILIMRPIFLSAGGAGRGWAEGVTWEEGSEGVLGNGDDRQASCRLLRADGETRRPATCRVWGECHKAADSGQAARSIDLYLDRIGQSYSLTLSKTSQQWLPHMSNLQNIVLALFIYFIFSRWLT